MSALYSHAIRWEWIKYNPITAVRQSAKRSKVPIVLTIEQIQALLPHLEEPCHSPGVILKCRLNTFMKAATDS